MLVKDLQYLFPKCLIFLLSCVMHPLVNCVLYQEAGLLKILSYTFGHLHVSVHGVSSCWLICAHSVHYGPAKYTLLLV